MHNYSDSRDRIQQIEGEKGNSSTQQNLEMVPQGAFKLAIATVN